MKKCCHPLLLLQYQEIIKQLLFILLFFFISIEIVLAETTIGKGKHKHLGKVSEFDSCSIAEQRAKKEAIKNSSEAGEKVSSEIYSNCSEVDGELECERNQFAIFSLNGIIHNWNKTKEIYDRKPVGKVSSCEIEGEGIVKPIIKNSDPDFHLTVELNREIFRGCSEIDGKLECEKMKIKINPNKEMFIYIFLWDPYSNNKNKAVTKIFPNIDFNKNTNNLVSETMDLEYDVFFPENVNKNRTDEYLITVGSEEEIKWLSNYSLEKLKTLLNREKILMDKVNSSYIIVRNK